MNIFVTSPDPLASAQALDDLRLNKMILETTQMLCTVITKLGGKTRYAPAYGLHPCTLWAGETNENFNWLATHGVNLVNEKAMRTPNSPTHLSHSVMLEAIAQRHLVPRGPQTMFANCTPFKHLLDVTVAYRLTLNCKWHEDAAKKRIPRWTLREPPPWLIAQRVDLERVLEKMGCEFPQSAVTPVSAKTRSS